MPGAAAAAQDERAKRLANLQKDAMAAADREAGLAASGLASDVLGWLDGLAQAPVDAEQANSAAVGADDMKDTYNLARDFLWSDQDEAKTLPPLIGGAKETEAEEAEEEEDDWETELQAADRDEEFKAFQSHYNENSVRCSFASTDDAAVCSLRLLLPSLGFTVLQFWVATASDYPESPALCLILGGPFTPELRLRIMRNIGHRLGTMVGASMLRPLVDSLSEDDSWLLAEQAESGTEAVPEAQPEAAPEPEPEPAPEPNTN
eukprot:COSAG06_NODE_12369_length_1390_cov_1.342370_2_plen_261_part_01